MKRSVGWGILVGAGFVAVLVAFTGSLGGFTNAALPAGVWFIVLAIVGAVMVLDR